MSALPAPQRRTGGPDPGPDPPPGAAPLRPPPANERRALRRRPRPSQPHRIQTAERDGARAGGRARGGLQGGGANGNIRAPSDAPPPHSPPPTQLPQVRPPPPVCPPSPPHSPHTPQGKGPNARGASQALGRGRAPPLPHMTIAGCCQPGARPPLLSSPLPSRHRGGSLEAIPPNPLSPAALSLRRRDARGSRGQKEPPRIPSTAAAERLRSRPGAARRAVSPLTAPHPQPRAAAPRPPQGQPPPPRVLLFRPLHNGPRAAAATAPLIRGRARRRAPTCPLRRSGPTPLPPAPPRTKAPNKGT